MEGILERSELVECVQDLPRTHRVPAPSKKALGHRAAHAGVEKERWADHTYRSGDFFAAVAIVSPILPVGRGDFLRSEGHRCQAEGPLKSGAQTRAGNKSLARAISGPMRPSQVNRYMRKSPRSDHRG